MLRRMTASGYAFRGAARLAKPDSGQLRCTAGNQCLRSNHDVVNVRAAMRKGSRDMQEKCAAAALACVIILLSNPSLAQENFAGRTVTLTIGYGPGSGNDVYGRLIARHLGKHIPGQPNVVPQNMPGAGSFKAANYLFAGGAEGRHGDRLYQPDRGDRGTARDRRRSSSRPRSSTGSAASAPTTTSRSSGTRRGSRRSPTR